MLALFDKAAHFADTMPPGSPGLFADSLAGQEIVGDTLAERAVRDNCVRVLTAHRSKGLEWDVVVVAGVQEEIWPDLRRRGSVLGAGELAETAHPGEVPGRRPGRRTWTPRCWPPSCWPRNAGCSTSRSPGPGGCWWSPPRAARTATSGRPGS